MRLGCIELSPIYSLNFGCIAKGADNVLPWDLKEQELGNLGDCHYSTLSLQERIMEALWESCRLIHILSDKLFES